MSELLPPTRRLLFLAALAVVCLGGAVAVAALPRLGSHVSDPDPTTGNPVELGYTAAPGVNLELRELTSAQFGQQLDTLALAGIRWIRFTLPWDQIEQTRGRFDWAVWDGVFAEIGARPGFRPVVVLNGTPAWARREGDGQNPLAPPQQRSEFGAFAAAVASRYGSQVRYYQIWHEPNIAPHWGARDVDPADYLGLLREAAVQIRAADGDAEIVLAALAPTTETGGANLSDIAYLDSLYRLGAADRFDVVAAQPYGFEAPADAAPAASTLNFSRVLLLRKVMLDHNDIASPLWVTAFGWNAAPAFQQQPVSPWGSVTEQAQAAYASRAYEMGATRWPWIGPMFWAAFCPQRDDQDPWLGFGLCNADGVKRTTWYAVAAAASAPGVLAPGRYRPNYPALSYDPGWRVTSEAADPHADGDRLHFTFNGTGVALLVQGGPYWAYYRVWVDDRPANRLPVDESGASYLVLYDPGQAARTVPLVESLRSGEHRVVVEAHGGWGQWALREVIVSAAEPHRYAWASWVLLAVGMAAAVASAAVAWPSRKIIASRLSAMKRNAAVLTHHAGWPLAAALLAVLLVSQQTIIDVTALLLLAVLFIIRPDLAPPLIAATLPFWQRPEVLLRWEFSHFEILTWLGVLALGLHLGLARLGRDANAPTGHPDGSGARRALHGTLSRWRGLLPRSLDWPVLALVVVGLAASVLAAEQGVAWREWRILFVGGALFYWLVTRTPPLEGHAFSPWPLVRGLLAGMVAASALGLWQLLSGQGRVDVEGVWRVRALYGSPNNLALLLGRGVPLALAVAAFDRHGARRAGAGGVHGGKAIASWGPQVGYLAAAVLMLAACVATFSKGALLLGLPVGLAAVALGGAWRERKRWPLLALAGLAVAGGIGLALLFSTPRFADLLNFETGTSFLRLKLWQGAWNMAVDHPWLGVGPDNFLYAYRTRYVLPSAWQELNLSHPHNLILDLWTRLGLIGVSLGIWGLASGFRRGFRLLQTCSNEWPLVLGLLAGLVATVAHGLIDNSLFLVDLMGVYMITLGIFWRLEGRCAS